MRCGGKTWLATEVTITHVREQRFGRYLLGQMQAHSEVLVVRVVCLLLAMICQVKAGSCGYKKGGGS
jgi:hypothetical protein